VTSIIN